jgi:hypothetical protein
MNTVRLTLIGFGLLGVACISTPEPKAPRAGEAVPWRTSFGRADWISEWQPQPRGAFGLDNLAVETPSEGPFRKVLRASFPKGSSSPAASRNEKAPLGGGQFYGRMDRPVDHLFLRYYLRFPPGFDFVKGGKLPGLYGGTETSGGRIPDGTNGFSTRFMWRTNGEGELYAYLPSSDKYGTSLKRGSFSFTPGQWHCIEQELTLNTPGKPDGVVRGWLDGKSTFQQEGLLFRTVPTLQIEGVFFSTFFGGSDTTWAATADTHVDFADFATGPTRVGCGT